MSKEKENPRLEFMTELIGFCKELDKNVNDIELATRVPISNVKVRNLHSKT